MFRFDLLRHGQVADSELTGSKTVPPGSDRVHLGHFLSV